MIVESATTLQEAITAELNAGMTIMKDETLYNLSLESPLLRDVDFLKNHSIATVWRGRPIPRYADIDASLRKRDKLREDISRRVREGDGLLDTAKVRMESLRIMETEGLALENLGGILL
jgi:hypothetical protein